MSRRPSWRRVVSEFVAAQTNRLPDDPVPLTVGYMALASSMAAFVRWVEHPDEDLAEHLRFGYDRLKSAFAFLQGAPDRTSE
jgi:MftR C-terminal domain